MDRFEEKDFNDIMLKGIMQLSDKDNALEKYPSLKKYPAFNVQIPDYNKILKYVALVYDMRTPLHIIADVMARKVEAANLANIGLKSSLFNELAMCTNESYVDMTMWYVRMHKNMDYTEYTVCTESYYWQQKKLLQDAVGDGEKTKDFISNSQALRKRLDELRNTLFNSDKSEKLLKAIDIMVEEELLLSPELMAKMIKEKGKDEAKNYLSES
jgi:hypothetical protein